MTNCTVQKELLEWASDKELLLLFNDFKTMGEMQDAEAISLSEILSAEDLQCNGKDNIADTVLHVLDPPFTDS